MNNRLTILLGAGSTLDLGTPNLNGMFSTQELTEKLIRDQYPALIDPGTSYIFKHDHGVDPKISPPLKNQHFYQVPIIPLIYHSLKAHYDVVDFELMLHSIEQLLTFSDSTRYFKPGDIIRYPLASFTEIQDRYRSLCDPLLLQETRRHFVRSIFSQIVDRVCLCGGLKNASRNLREFFDDLKQSFLLKTFTLNYDDLVDESLPEGFDGFDDLEPEYASNLNSSLSYLKFNPKEFMLALKSNVPLLIHLHGSVRFGDSRHCDRVVKYKTSNEALESIKNIIRSTDSKHGEYLGSDPIISGLNKVAKLIHNPTPFGYYYQAFMDAIMNSNRLLVIGYGARDEHLNTWIREFVKFYGEERRVVWISKICENRIGANDHEINFLNFLAGGKPDFKEWMACEELEEPDHFQDHGPCLRLIPSGFPFKNGEIIMKAIDYLKS